VIDVDIVGLVFGRPFVDWWGNLWLEFVSWKRIASSEKTVLSEVQQDCKSDEKRVPRQVGGMQLEVLSTLKEEDLF
jgi:hypothetical protein